MIFMRWLILASFIFALSSQAEAKTFANQFVEFQLPDKWECQLDGTEWVCQSTDEQKKRDAIIVLAAKIRKPGMDELDSYREHLKKKQLYQSLSGETVESQPKYVKDTVVSGTTWVDSLHLQSEIPDFYTRYLATVVQDLGILVTFSVRKDKYNEYSADIDALVKSLKAFRKPGDINKTNGEGLEESQNPDDLVFDKAGDKKNAKNTAPRGNNEDANNAILLVILLALAGGYIIWRRRKR